MKWFKFYGQDYLSDPKILTLTAGERSCWLTLLAYGSIDETGTVFFLDENKLMIQSGIDPLSDEWSKTRGVLEKLKNFKMITLDNGMITLVNWSKRQETNLTSYERVKRWREKYKKMKHNDNAMITSEENRIEIKKEKTPPHKWGNDGFNQPVKTLPQLSMTYDPKCDICAGSGIAGDYTNRPGEKCICGRYERRSM